MISAAHMRLVSGKKATDASETNPLTTTKRKDKQSEGDSTFDVLLGLFAPVSSLGTPMTVGSGSHPQVAKSELSNESGNQLQSNQMTDRLRTAQSSGKALHAKLRLASDEMVRALTFGNANTSTSTLGALDVGPDLSNIQNAKNSLVHVKGEVSLAPPFEVGTILDGTDDATAKRLKSNVLAKNGEPFPFGFWNTTAADSSQPGHATESSHQQRVHINGLSDGQSDLSSTIVERAPMRLEVWNQAMRNLSASRVTSVHSFTGQRAASEKSGSDGEHVNKASQPQSVTTPAFVSVTQGLVQSPTSHSQGTGNDTAHVLNVGQPGWSQSLASTMSLHVSSGNTGTLSIHVHPEGLGSIMIQAVHGADGVSLNVSSSNPHMVDLLNQSTPELKSTLSAQGVTLSNVSVSYDGSMQQGQDSQNRPPRGKPVFAITRSSERTAESTSRAVALELSAPLRGAHGTTISMQV